MRKLVIALSCLVATQAVAEIAFVRLRDDIRVVSLAYDPLLCAVWVADEGPTLTLLNALGEEILAIESGMRSVRSLTVEEDGLLIANGWGDFRRIDREGRERGVPFSLNRDLRDVEGLHRDADGSFLVVEDDPARLMRVAPDGQILMEIDGGAMSPPMTEPQGVGRDPYSGNILVVDDNEGLNALFELAPDGRVLGVTPLSDWGYDAEAVALQPESGRLFVGFDGGTALAIFDWRPSEITIDEPLDRGPDCAMM